MFKYVLIHPDKIPKDLPLNTKLEVIHEDYLASKYKKAAYRIEDRFKSGISF